jgi:camphor 5-monooxygenase
MVADLAAMGQKWQLGGSKMSISLTVEGGAIPDHVPGDRVFDVDIFDFVRGDEDYHNALKRYQGPNVPALIWTPRNGGHWIATRAEVIRDILNDPAQFSSRLVVIPKAAAELWDLIPISLDPPEHGAIREILDKVVNPRQIRALESRIRDVAIELIEPWVAKGGMDFSSHYAEEFPVRVFMAIMNLPIQDAPMLKHFVTQLFRPIGATPAEKAAALRAAIDGFYEYCGKALDARTLHGIDGVSLVANSFVDGHEIKRQTAISLITNLLIGGLDTVAGFLGFAMLFLARNPEQTKELVEKPEKIPGSVEELFRRFGLASPSRVVRHDLEYKGTLLKEGDMIHVPTAMSGLDDALNVDPMRVEFSRPRPLHFSFGVGHHRCPGQHLARTEITVTLQEWLKRIPEFRVVESSKPKYRTGMINTVEGIQFEWKRD